MPRRKKKPEELPVDEALRKLFPKKVRDQMKETALQSQKKSTKKESKS
jgi:hypothetical protein